MKIAWYKELKGEIREAIKGLRWLLLDSEDLPNATAALMFAELDGVLIGIDHRGKTFINSTYNRSVHLLMLDEDMEIPNINKIETTGKIEDHLW